MAELQTTPYSPDLKQFKLKPEELFIGKSAKGLRLVANLLDSSPYAVSVKDISREVGKIHGLAPVRKIERNWFGTLLRQTRRQLGEGWQIYSIGSPINKHRENSDLVIAKKLPAGSKVLTQERADEIAKMPSKVKDLAGICNLL